MKRKEFENMPVPTPKRNNSELIGKALAKEDWLILDLFKRESYYGRYIINTESGRHSFFEAAGKKWNSQKLLRIMGFNPIYDTYAEKAVREKLKWDVGEDKEIAIKALKARNAQNVLDCIGWLETEFDRNQRDQREISKNKKIDRLMENVKDEDPVFSQWIYDTFAEGTFLFWDGDTKSYGCSNCGAQIHEKKLDKPKNGERRICPECGQEAIVQKRRKKIDTAIKICKLERPDPKFGVSRNFRAGIWYDKSGHEVYLDEEIRILLYQKGCEEKSYTIFYSQDGDVYSWYTGIKRSNWYTTNPKSKRFGKCFLYPEGIREALKDTKYENLINAFVELSGKGIFLNYNVAVAAGGNVGTFGTMLEYLAKGRFYKLIKDEVAYWPVYNSEYVGCMNLNGETIEEVMGIRDKQKINRIREENGGKIMLEWMRYSERHNTKIPKKTMDCLETHYLISPEKIESLPGNISSRMSAEQIVNYIQKQAEKCYGTLEFALDHWADYLSMCAALDKSLDDELFYKPKDLKRRHDELIEDSRKVETVKRMNENPELRQQEAARMEEKFQGASAVMREIKEKYEFAAEGFQMIMPENPVDIVREGYALHHCAGSSERYFNRIENRETYIGFLRRQKEPNIPFYTIEFEPGGTIRQNRSYYDEEPGIEEIREFLKLWQKEIKKRLTQKDKEHAAKSAVLREQNIKELQENRNSFVLKKLEEDFMEAV